MASGMGNARADTPDGKSPETVREPVVPVHDDRDPVGAVRGFRVAEVLPTIGPTTEKIVPEPRVEPPEPDDPVEADAPDSGESGGKVIYLTFDDGPTVPYTKRVLAVLDEYDAKATFFQTGENATYHPELTRSVVAHGHALGNHSWNHRDLRGLSARKVRLQITRTSAVLGRVSGQPVTCLRPPYGAVNARVRSAIRSRNLAMKMWDIDPRDWDRPGVGAIASRVVSRADPGDVSLMHDGGGKRTQSVRALRRILRTLSDRGYRFETLPGC
jgi:peptidoglycan/xylan/chitin deacetylase (PgdA/CDA1 family)